MEIKTTEFFKNIKKLPPDDSEEFKQLIDWEIEKCTGGITVNGIYISGWLYFHINHWYIRIDTQDNFGNGVRIESLPELRDNEWIRAEYLERCRVEKKGYMEVGGRQSGKALLNSSILYRSYDEITIGEVNIGDEIYDESGKLTKVLAKYPQGLRPTYKISFIDGREIYCDENHKWLVKDRFLKKIDKTFVKTTKDILENYRRERASWSNRKNSFEFRYSIPNNNAVEYNHAYQTVDPYFLGLWLGDGSNSYSKITTIDKEIEGFIREYASSVGLQVTVDDTDTFMITSGIMGGDKKEKGTRNFIHQYLKSLYNNKHIPNEYLYSSIDQRMELLRGLMDSDGCCDKSGAITFSSSIPQLADDFYKLCRSLGIVLNKKIKKTSYKKNGVRVFCKDSCNFTLFTNKPIFKLNRKLSAMRTNPKYKDWISIVNIEYIGNRETTCIVVDNDSHLFLTDNYTPTHNSEMEASYFGMNATLFRNTQNVIVCGNDNDLSLLKDKVDFGLRKLWKGISIPRLDKTWRLNQIRLGYKTPDGEDEIWSYIIIRNAKDGNNTEVAAGTTAKTFIMDEVGKYPFASAFKAAEPAFKGKFGWRAVPILVGTGGAFEHGKDAENFFYNPASNNFLGIPNEKTNNDTAIFLSGLYRQDCKEETTLDKWFETEKGILIPNNSELSKIKINVANKEKAQQLIEKEREAAKTNPDRTLFLKQKMYYPLTVDECFLTESQNIFDVEACKRQKARLLSQERTGTSVELFHDGEKICHKISNKLPISNFPLRSSDSKDAPVVIYEFPVESPPYGLYVAGVDSYKTGQAKYSDSLGTVYIFKRMTSISGEGYQNMVVASYAARPDKKETWEEQARLLIKYYNARTLVENDELSFIDYMIAKGEARYLEVQPEWLKEIVPNTTVRRDYGIHRSSEKIRNFLHGCAKKYMEEVVYQEKDENGSIIKETLGVTKIFDPVLLEELIQYNEDINADRVIAFELAVALSMKLDPILGVIGDRKDDISNMLGKPKKQNVLFANGSNLFVNRKQKLWR